MTKQSHTVLTSYKLANHFELASYLTFYYFSHLNHRLFSFLFKSRHIKDY